jgi:D-alanyl-lipoteichoic acid acyltransferase DltB (MBOAT superfamily)
MTFIQVEFLWLMVAVFATYWSLPKRWMQNALLVLVSAVFYGWVHPWFLILLYSSAVLDYNVALRMRSQPERKKLFLLISMAGNLGMLGYFKYVDFFIGNFIAIFDTLGIQTSMHTLGVFLPVGISFYTFQTMSYSIDVYRGDVEPRKNFLDYVTFVSFFPQLVAGPVERAGNLLAQVEADRQFSWVMVRSGLSLALWGATKKVLCADTIAPYVDKVFVLQDPSGPMIWAATLGFSIQILADFSGYTDIARGVARMLGFNLVLNFDHPYMSRNPSEFWRRWHISFSTWIRDYIYIPVGGSRGGFARATRSTFIAMLLSGLWHGAAWTFVLWGAYHAALLTGYRIVTRRIPKSVRDMRWGAAPIGDWLAIVIMFGFTMVGWLIFRETHIDRLADYFTLVPWTATAEQWTVTWVILGMCLLSSLPLVGGLVWAKWLGPKLEQTPWALPAQTVGWAVATGAIYVFHRDVGNDFIYFQF